MITPRQLLPLDWTDNLGQGKLAFGLDLATTESETSNPSALVVMEAVGERRIERLTLRWKTDDPRVTEAIVLMVATDVVRSGRQWRAAAIDASNETFFAKELARKLRKYVNTSLIKSGAKTSHKGESYSFKTLLGLLYVSLFEDGLISTANAKWLNDDRRLVKKHKGGFNASLGDRGAHADTFDAGKLANYALSAKTGGIAAAAAAVGAWAQKFVGSINKNRPPFAHLHRRK